MHNPALRLAALSLFILAPGTNLRALFAGDVRLMEGGFRIEGHRVMLRGVGYAPLALGAQPTDPVPPCVYARDLPLIATTGANAVRTFRVLPEGDTAFTAVLGTTGLHWLAGFPLDAWYDPGRTLAGRRDEILAAFRAYAERFRGEPRLIGYVFGQQVTEDYGGKFAGPVNEFYALLGEAAAVLKEVDPEGRPLLTTGTATLADVALAPPGLDFWTWDAGPKRSLARDIDAIRQSAAKPVLIGSYSAPADFEEGVEAAAVLGLTREIYASAATLGAAYATFAGEAGAGGGLFRLAASEVAGLDTVLPRATYHTLSKEWEGIPPASWTVEGAPVLSQFAHAATGDGTVAPGTLVRFAGQRLSPAVFAANGIPWPLHLGQVSMCIGGNPAPMAMVSEGSGSALVPWDSPTGDQPVLLFRGGVATNLQTAKVRTYAPGIFEGAVVRAGSLCRVTADNGVRPGELLEIYASGLGPGAPSWMTPSVIVNGAAAEVLYSGTLPTLAGLNQVNVRLDPATPASTGATLQLRSASSAAPPYPIRVAGLEDRFGLALAAPPGEVVVQAGGAGKVIEIQAEGRNGYCGPVVLGLAGAPAGVALHAAVGATGSAIPVELRATEDAAPQTGTEVVLTGQAPGATLATAAVKLTVLAGRGEVRLRVISGGYKSSPLARFDWNGRTLHSTTGGGAGRGISVMAVDPATGVFSLARTFDTWGSETASSELAGYINGLPSGTVVLFAVADDASLRLSTQARAVIAATFGSRFIEALAYQESWAMLGRKGASAPIGEARSADTQVTLEHTLRFPAP